MSSVCTPVVFAGLAAMLCVSPVSIFAADEIVGVGNFSHIVQSMDKSLAFYRDGLGLEVTVDQPFSPNPAIMKLGNTPGAQSRFVALKVPGSGSASS